MLLEKKKIRGKKRKFRQFKAGFKRWTTSFPEQEDFWNGGKDGFSHFHMPYVKELIDSSSHPTRTRREFVKCVIDTTYSISCLQPREPHTRVISLIEWPYLWESQIIVFYGSEYYDIFFERNSSEQTWTPKEGNWLNKRLNLDIPKCFEERVYHSVSQELPGVLMKDTIRESDLIFVGEFRT